MHTPFRCKKGTFMFPRQGTFVNSLASINASRKLADTTGKVGKGVSSFSFIFPFLNPSELPMKLTVAQ